MLLCLVLMLTSSERSVLFVIQPLSVRAQLSRKCTWDYFQAGSWILPPEGRRTFRADVTMTGGRSPLRLPPGAELRPARCNTMLMCGRLPRRTYRGQTPAMPTY